MKNNRQSTVKTQIILTSDLEAWKPKMIALYGLYYDFDPTAFAEKMKKSDYYAIYTDGDRLAGFTGLRMRTIDTPEGKVETLYIGQTVMHSDYRGHSLIPRTCVRLLARHYLQHPLRPIYVWCDALTFKPYLLFANSVKNYYPNRHGHLPVKVKSILDQLGGYYYGDQYDPQTGTVHKPANVICDPTATITARERRHPDIDFFARVNPEYINGHGLLIIAPMDYRNFAFLVVKCIKKVLGVKRSPQSTFSTVPA